MRKLIALAALLVIIVLAILQFGPAALFGG
jgi:hypothetical protein